MALTSDILASTERFKNYKMGKAPLTIFNKIEILEINPVLQHAFFFNWFLENICIGPEILSINNIIQNDKFQIRFDNGLIKIGDCANGDEIYIRLKDLAILYWSHDESDDWDEIKDSELHLTFVHLDYFLINIRNGNYIPYDSYTAREYYKLYSGK
jgi:hypothetical protein